MHVNRLFASVTICAVLVFSLPALVASAWGPRAMRGITRTAMHVLPSDVGGALRQYEDEIFAGASISDEELLKRFPQYGFGDPVLTVSSEIELLRTAKAGGVSSYFAYRMGVLGQLVAAMNQPFFTVPGSERVPSLRERYEADAEVFSATGISYEASERRYLLDVRTYFEQQRGYLEDAETLIASEYDTGAGFRGYGKRSLSVHFTNAVNAVADAWFTVLGEVPAGVQPATRPVSLRGYYVDAIGFYLGRDDDDGASRTHRFLESAGLLEEDTLKRVGDQYYENARYEQAIALYRAVLEKAPRRTDVRRRISDYFFKRGLALLTEKQYEQAEEAFDEVLRSDVSRSDAREKKLEAERLIEERRASLELAQARVDDARKAIATAARAEAQRKFAEAVALYRQAGEAYAKVGDEFEEEYIEASRAATRIEARIAHLIEELVGEVRGLQPVAVREQTRELIRNGSEQELLTLATRLVQDEHADKARVLRLWLIGEEKRALQE